MEEQRDFGAGCSTALMLGLSPLFLGPCLAGLNSLVPWTWPLNMAYFSGMICTLAIWLATGTVTLWVRLSVAMLPGTAFGLLIYGVKFPEMPHESHVTEFAMLALLVPLASLPSFGLRSLGYRLIFIRGNKAKAAAPPYARPLQFSLRQLFGLTFVVAVYAFFARLLAANNVQASNDGAQMVVFVLLALGAAGAAWAALGPVRPATRLLLIALISGSVMLLLRLGFGARNSESYLGVVWLTLHPLVIGSALALFREIGYRLVRIPPTENARPGETPI
jgi:hypothetical protein